MNKREAYLELMAHWTQAWTTLGRWQALNARLSTEMTRLTVSSRRWRAAPGATLVKATQAQGSME